MVVAAGGGSRFGTAKQYELLDDFRLLDWSLAAARTVARGVVAVIPPDRDGQPEPGADAVVAGGATRAASVRAGLAAVPADAEIVVVHDAVRPLASANLFRAVVDALEPGVDGVVPIVPVADTLRRVRDGEVTEVFEREGVVAVQTPQAFRADALRRAHENRPEATDDAGLVEQAGGRLVAVRGERVNVKVTTPEDLALLEAVVRGVRRP